MAKRFASHTESEIETKRATLIPTNTKKSNNSASKTFRAYLSEKEQDTDFEDVSKPRLDEALGHFYLDARKQDGSLYKTTTLEHFPHGLNRYLKAPLVSKKFDLLKDQDFHESNECFKTAVSDLKSSGKGVINHHNVICPSDREKMYTSIHMSAVTPAGLANKVQFDIRLYFCRRGCENMEKMTKSTLKVKTDPKTNLKFVTKDVNKLTKIHRDDKELYTGHMPEEPGSPYCPVKSFEKYLSKSNPKNDRLWQFPLDSYCDEDYVWYANRPIGKDTLSKCMSNMSQKCKLSQQYTNHCIRATAATILTQSNFTASQIMAITGHKSVSLCTNVCQTMKKKTNMGRAIASGISPTAGKENVPSVLPPTVRLALPPSHQKVTPVISNTVATRPDFGISLSGNNQELPPDLQGLELDQLFSEMYDPHTTSAQSVSLRN
ncbi:uncharacterized protein LOC110440331 [Mizuhopecten yessoensis]|uniref:uncharacterized protein LOC110440331 n=1 Tax=Mizuhopecten yessoensis TaxID=6573 RepID=UPI000B45D735|nr:uncharacterized protein LOC110440331 [Mizuhopecten yessoensis]